MRSAPSVVVDLPGSRRWSLALAALGGAAAAGGSATVLAHLRDQSRFSAAAAAFTLIAAAAGAWLAWRFAPHDRGRLGWDGAQWQLDGAPGRLQVMIDLGGWMLLCFEPAEPDAGRRRWLPVSDARAPQALGLRAAVYCRPLPDPTLPGRLPE